MKIDNNVLIDGLLTLTNNAIELAKEYKTLTIEQLNFKYRPTEWSILQCLEHLNLYGAFYLPEIEKQILASKKHDVNMMFTSGIVGGYFADLMLVKNGKIKKMKSPKSKIPSNSELSITTIDQFLKQQELLKSLLNQARTIDLTKIKSAISLTKHITLRLGDTFRFYVYHIDRHISQAVRAKNRACQGENIPGNK